MASIFDDLGALFTGGQQPAPDATAGVGGSAGIKGQWDSWMSDPANRAALLGFGIQALAGGGGSFNQQLAAALGNGAASAQGYDQLVHQRETEAADRDFRERQLSSSNSRADAQLASTERIHAADRASREKIANIYADQRLATAGMRVDQHPLIQQEFMKAYNITHSKYADPLSRQMDPSLPKDAAAAEAEIERRAQAAGTAAANAFQARFGTGGAPIGGTGTSVNPTNGGAPGGNPPGNIPQISPGSPVAPATPTTTGAKPTLQQLLANPQYAATVQRALQDPAARAILKSKVADPTSIDAFAQPAAPQTTDDDPYNSLPYGF